MYMITQKLLLKRKHCCAFFGKQSKAFKKRLVSLARILTALASSLEGAAVSSC